MADDRIDVVFGAQIDDLKSGLKQAESAVSNTAEHMKGSLGGAAETVGNQFKQFQASINAATGGIAESLKGATEAFSGFIGGLVIFEAAKEVAEAFEKIGEAIHSVAERGDELLKAGQKTGIAVEQLSELKYAAGLADVDFGSLQTALTRLSVNMEKASHGTGEAAGAFQALGIKVTDTEGHLRPLNDVMKDVADKFAGMEDGPGKAAIAVAIFGRAGAQLIPLLDQGSQSLSRMENEAKQFGVTFSGPAAEAAEQFNDNLKRLGEAVSGVWQTFVEKLLPALSDLFDQMANIIGNSPLLKDAIEGIGVAFGGVLLVLDGVVAGLRSVFDIISIIFHELYDALAANMAALRDLFTGNFSAIEGDFKSAADKMKQDFISNVHDMADAYEHFQQAVAKTFGGGEGPQAESGPAKRPAPQIAETGGGASMVEKWREEFQERQIAEQNFFRDSTQEELNFWEQKLALTSKGSKDQLEVESRIYQLKKQLAQQGLQQQLTDLKTQADEAKRGSEERIADEQKVADLLKEKYGEESVQYKQALKAVEDAQRDHAQYMKEMSLQQVDAERQLGQLKIDQEKANAEVEVATGRLSNTEKIDLLRQFEDESYQIELQALQQKLELYKEDEKAYKQTLNQMDQLKAQHNIRLTQLDTQATEAARQHWQSIVSPITGAFRQITNGILQGTQTWQQVIGNALDNVVTAFANAGEQWLETWLINLLAGETAHKATAVSEITTDAATSAAGAYSSVAAIPYVGWAMAPAVAAGAEAAVLGFASFDVGTVGVPHDMMAQVHKDEIIIPQTFSDGLRSGDLQLGAASQNNAGGDVHFHNSPMISATTPKSFADQLQENSSELKRWFMRSVRDGSLKLPQRS